jgi:hypothetical protein
MKHVIGLFTFGLLAGWLPIEASDLQTSWNDLCRVAGTRQLNITTSDGRALSGTCGSTTADELSLKNKQLVVKVARATLTRIQMYDPGTGHHLADLGNGMSKSFQQGFRWLFSPAAALGLVTIPATVAWGAVAAPFCLLGDMGSDGPSTQEIKLTN